MVLNLHMTHAKNALRDITETPDMGITLSDGCRLSARVWMPVDAGDDPVPVILEYLPYRKRDGTTARDALTHPYFARRGYACVRVDMRGNGDSEGVMEDEYSPQELSDAVEVIDWLAAQPWCSGTVGMMGISWGGFNSLQVAALAPEPLKAIITLCSTVDRYADDIHYKGGCLLNENMGWGSTMWAYSSRPPDPALVGEKWRDMWIERLENEPLLAATWLRHQKRDAYWQHGSVCEDFSAIKAKVLAVGGWGDAYKNAVAQLVENLPGAKGIVGPWVHKYPHFAVPEPRIGFLQEALRWWDQWLKGVDTGVVHDPAFSAYVMDGVRPATWYTDRPGTWVHQAALGDGTETRELTMASGGALRESPDGAEEPMSVVIASPQHCGMDGGEYCAIWLGPEMPGDQRADDAYSACFTTEPLGKDTTIHGAPSLRLRLTCDKAQGQIAVRLNHVHPDGASTRITYGVLNLTHHASHVDPTDLEPGQEIEVTLSLDHIAYQVPAGHRLRVAVSNAYWPLIWPSPEKTVLTLMGGVIRLPVHNGDKGMNRSFPPPDADAPWQVDTLRAASNSRRVVTDLNNGNVTLEIVDDFGKVRDSDHGLISGSCAREWWTIHPDDPLSAQARTHWTEENARTHGVYAGWQTRTETHAEMWSDAESFYLKAELIAFEGEEEIYRREVSDKIARDHL